MDDLLEPFKLEKLKITAYSDRGRKMEVTSFDAMFNPASYSRVYGIGYEKSDEPRKSASEARYSGHNTETVSFDLLVDGTGVETMALLAPTPTPVADRVKKFLETAYTYNGSIHEPNFLILSWGTMVFKCRLTSATIAYSSFDRSGSPLRAKLTVAFRADDTAENIAKAENQTSPDVTHTRVVKAGDTLPLLTQEMYGSASHYLFVAAANGLDQFRDLRPGVELAFPPLETR